MEVEIAILAVSLIALVKFSTLTIRNAVRFSYLTGISQFAVGFVIIAMSTSLPELSIAVISSFQGNGALSLGNLIGANVSNMMLIFGVLAMAGFSLKQKDEIEAKRIILATSMIAAFLLILRMSDFAFGVFLFVMFYAFSKTIIKSGVSVKMSFRGLRSVESVKVLAYLLASIACVIVSAYFVTGSSIKIAGTLGFAESAIGATILAIGTTMPELSVNIAALRKKNMEIAIGDSVGSLMTNFMLILGVASLINPIAVGVVSATGLVLFIAAAAIFYTLLSRERFGIGEGLTLITFFAAYLLIMGAVGAL